jgi:hypothetical protein
VRIDDRLWFELAIAHPPPELLSRRPAKAQSSSATD